MKTLDRKPAARAETMPPLMKDKLFLFILVSLVVSILLLAIQSFAAETATVHGLILDSEMGAVMEADNGDVYFLDGPDMSSYFETLATVTGALTRDDGGNLYIQVTKVAPDLGSPADPARDPLNIKDETAG